MTLIYELEDEDRREYIAKWIQRELRLTKFTTIDEYDYKLNTLLRTPYFKLSEDSQNLRRYFKAETNKGYFKRDTFRRIQKRIQSVTIKQKEKQKTTRYIKKEKKAYSILYEESNIKYSYGFIKNEKVLVRTEKYTKNNKTFYRLRDKKGRFVSFNKE